jgi:hypothetical protein
MESVAEQFKNINKMPLFEIEVYNKLTNEYDYLIFDIRLKDNYFEVTYPSTTTEEEESEYVPHFHVDIDEDFNLDYHLGLMYETAIEIIINSEFYDLAD